MERTELIAREAIRDLIARYTWAGDRGRLDEVADCFAEDGVLDVGDDGGEWTGRSTIRAELEAVVARVAASGDAPSTVQHQVSSVLIELHDPSSATARSSFSVLTDIGLDHWGTYRDELVRDPAEGRWQFARRTVRVLGRSPQSRFRT